MRLRNERKTEKSINARAQLEGSFVPRTEKHRDINIDTCNSTLLENYTEIHLLL